MLKHNKFLFILPPHTYRWHLKWTIILPVTYSTYGWPDPGVLQEIVNFNSFPASGDFYRLLITFANNLVPDQDRHNVGPDLDPYHLTLIVFRNCFLKNYFWKKSAEDTNCKKKYPECNEFIVPNIITRKPVFVVDK